MPPVRGRFSSSSEANFCSVSPFVSRICGAFLKISPVTARMEIRNTPQTDVTFKIRNGDGFGFPGRLPAPGRNTSRK